MGKDHCSLWGCKNNRRYPERWANVPVWRETVCVYIGHCSWRLTCFHYFVLSEWSKWIMSIGLGFTGVRNRNLFQFGRTKLAGLTTSLRILREAHGCVLTTLNMDTWQRTCRILRCTYRVTQELRASHREGYFNEKTKSWLKINPEKQRAKHMENLQV